MVKRIVTPLRATLNKIGIVPHERYKDASIKNYLNTQTGEIISRRQAEQTVIGETLEQRRDRRAIERGGLDVIAGPGGQKKSIMRDYIVHHYNETGELLNPSQVRRSEDFKEIESMLKSKDRNTKRKALVRLGRMTQQEYDDGES